LKRVLLEPKLSPMTTT